MGFSETCVARLSNANMSLASLDPSEHLHLHSTLFPQILSRPPRNLRPSNPLSRLTGAVTLPMNAPKPKPKANRSVSTCRSTDLHHNCASTKLAIAQLKRGGALTGEMSMVPSPISIPRSADAHPMLTACSTEYPREN